MAGTSEQLSASFKIEALNEDDQRARHLWHELHGPSCTGTKPPHWLVARVTGSDRIVGLAQYFRAFPQEDACGAVLVVPEALHTGAGVELLQAMASQVLEDGICHLWHAGQPGRSRHHGSTAAGSSPVHISPMHGGLYVEVDLPAFTASL